MKIRILFVILGSMLRLLASGCVPQKKQGSGLLASSREGHVRAGRFTSAAKDLPIGDINLQRLVNNAPDGGVIEIPYGRYVLSESLTLARRKDLHIAFTPGSQLRIKKTDKAVIEIKDCNGLKISGVRARHVKPLAEYDCHGAVISIANSTNVSIDNCELNGCGAVGVFARKSTLRVTNCHIHSNTFNAFYLDSCEAYVIGNIIERNANTLQSYRCEEIMWSDNLVQDNGGYWRKPRKSGLRSDGKPDLRPLTGE